MSGPKIVPFKKRARYVQETLEDIGKFLPELVEKRESVDSVALLVGYKDGNTRTMRGGGRAVLVFLCEDLKHDLIEEEGESE